VPVEPAAGADPSSASFPQRHPAFGRTIPQDVTYVGFALPDDPRGDPDPAAARPAWSFVFPPPWAEPAIGLEAPAAGSARRGCGPVVAPSAGRPPGVDPDRRLGKAVTLPGWGIGASSAQLAAWCEQRPFRVCIHASDLLVADGPP
jgi:hypothetical protein